jgi:hypothetical protein
MLAASPRRLGIQNLFAVSTPDASTGIGLETEQRVSAVGK